MEKDSQFSFNCSNLTQRDFLSINLAFSTASIVCLLISLLIILVLHFYFKAYESLLQRLILYLMVATTLRELFLAASIEHQFKYRGQDEICTWIAFGFNWFGIVIYVFTVGIMIYLLYLVYRLAKGNVMRVPKFLQSKHHKIILECLYIILTALLSFMYSWFHTSTTTTN